MSKVFSGENMPLQLGEEFPVYTGDDLGVKYTPDRTYFRVWAPSASSLNLHIYSTGNEDSLQDTFAMEKDINGTWKLVLEGNWKNKFYTYQAHINGEWKREVPDPYATAVGINGLRGMIIDIDSTNPPGWEDDKRPPLKGFEDIIIWEIHMRDFSIHPSSGIQNKGKYLAFTEKETKSPEGYKTGIDHIIELGVTHVHLLPVFDFCTIDESHPEENQYNWGYDPQNYNTPEGSYSTNPYDCNVRILEFKKLVQSLHNNGIRVIMDVVYNHVFDPVTSSFDNLVPGYYFRYTHPDKLSNGSGCGNETASEKTMMRKFMLDSVCFWAQEYHIDGFRFDLMGLHDIETMNAIREKLNHIDPTIFIYGEGWTAGQTTLPENQRSIKANTAKLNGIAVFSDEIRDGIRGPWWDGSSPGFIAGQRGLEETIKFGVVASTSHPDITYNSVNYSKTPYADNPLQVISYVTCHDNYCLHDKIDNTCPHFSKDDKLNLQKFANAIVLTSQGIPFLHAGEEIVRTKFGQHNSYNLPDSINQLVWHNKQNYREVFDYYKKLIALRKNHPAFRMPDADMIRKHLRFISNCPELLVGFHIAGHANGDIWKDILVYYNANPYDVFVELPVGQWIIVATRYSIEENGSTIAGYNTPQNLKTMIPNRSIMILVDSDSIQKV